MESIKDDYLQTVTIESFAALTRRRIFWHVYLFNSNTIQQLGSKENPRQVIKTRNEGGKKELCGVVTDFGKKRGSKKPVERGNTKKDIYAITGK